jgi:Helix-turn-helix domain
MSHKAMSLVFKHSKSRGLARFLLVTLADHCNGKRNDFTCWPSLDSLAEKTKLSKRGVCKILTQLETLGEIKRERSTGGRNRRTRYTICVGENSEAPDTVSIPLNSEPQTLFHNSETVNLVTLNSEPLFTRIKPERTGILRAVKNRTPHQTENSDSQSGGKKTKKNGPPRYRETMGLFHDLFWAKFGAKPDIDGRDGKILSSLIRSHGAEEVQALLRFFFEYPPDWVEKKGKFTLPTFKGVYNELLAQSRSTKAQMSAF